MERQEQETESVEKVSQEQIHTILFSEQLSWQAIIYDLINTEQLNPWDVDLSVLTEKYLERIKDLEEANFAVSSKVLLAASILLRMKSDILLKEDIPTLDGILFGEKKEKKGKDDQQLELADYDDNIPHLTMRTPLPRMKKITLKDLIGALGKAIKTENRRIKKHILLRQREQQTNIVLPKDTRNLQDSIKGIYARLKKVFGGRDEELAFTHLHEQHGEDKITTFVSLLHLDNQQKVWLTQQGHFEEIYILLKEMYVDRNREKLERIQKEIEALQDEHLGEAGVEGD